MDVFRTKTVEYSIAETEEPEHRLRKSLGALDLTVFGVGVIIGAGIFVLTGTVAASNAGPAVAISFATLPSASIWSTSRSRAVSRSKGSSVC